MKRKIGLALGVYDFCHAGHINFLKLAASNCDELIIGLHTDDTVVKYKGELPLNSELERLTAVKKLNITRNVEIFKDRRELCERFDVNVVFHGDDWSENDVRAAWGEELISDLDLEIKILPHTPGVSSTKLRKQIRPIGWWLYSPNINWPRSHIFDHVKDLYQQLGGTWFVSELGRDLVRQYFPDAPCVLIQDGLDEEQAAEALLKYNLDVLVVPHFNFEKLRSVCRTLSKPINLVVLSHGRSGKPNTSKDHFNNCNRYPIIEGNLHLYDWSYDQHCYTHLDIFLDSGGRFTNHVPKHIKPKILILPTWKMKQPDGKKFGHKFISLIKRLKRHYHKGLLHDIAWANALKPLSENCELLLSPHPLSDEKTLNQFVARSGAKLLPSHGRSFENVPDVNCVICDLSGVFWEAMLFDTPLVLATSGSISWPKEIAPSSEDVKSVIPFVTADQLYSVVHSLLDKRVPEQHQLAEQRLGVIDGQATKRVVERIENLLI